MERNQDHQQPLEIVGLPVLGGKGAIPVHGIRIEAAVFADSVAGEIYIGRRAPEVTLGAVVFLN